MSLGDHRLKENSMEKLIGVIFEVGTYQILRRPLPRLPALSGSAEFTSSGTRAILDTVQLHHEATLETGLLYRE